MARKPYEVEVKVTVVVAAEEVSRAACPSSSVAGALLRAELAALHTEHALAKAEQTAAQARHEVARFSSSARRCPQCEEGRH